MRIYMASFAIVGIFGLVQFVLPNHRWTGHFCSAMDYPWPYCSD